MKPRCQQGHAPSGGLREAPSCLFQLTVAPGAPGLVAASGQSFLCLPVASPLCVCVSSCLLPEPPSSLAATRALHVGSPQLASFSPSSCPACSVHKSQRPCPAQTLMSKHGSSRTRALLAPQPQPSPLYTAPLSCFSCQTSQPVEATTIHARP